jgi:hypothetical protein
MTQLAPRNFASSEVVRNQWHALPEYETPPEALLNPAYWAHVSAKMRRGDIVYALSQENSWFMELLVLDVGKLFAKVCQLRLVNIEPAQMLNVAVPEGFSIKFRGPKKWSVLRGLDVLKEDMSKAEAETWMSDHIKGAKAA